LIKQLKPYVIGFIFARGGSKGIPRKNLQLLDGVPLIAHSIKAAFDSKYISRTIVSTDDQEIAKVAKNFGAEVPFIRPSELASDNSPEWLSWQHAIKTIKEDSDYPVMDVFASVPVTAPLRSHIDIDNCVELLLRDNLDMVVTATSSTRHPAYNMIKIDEKGYCDIVMKPKAIVSNRQNVPFDVFDMTTVAYVAKPEYVLSAKSVFEGKVKAVIVPPERAIDIDTGLDLKFAEFLINMKSK
jgi:CMP-N-acetylneuraminic acid synthetase